MLLRTCDMKKILFLFCLLLITFESFSQLVIPMDTINGVFKINCTVNGVPMSFIFDTGATDVSISLTEALFLIKNGFLKPEDIKGDVTYTIANGQIEQGTKILLREIKIGGLILNNIEASVVHNADAPLLLGLNVISKLGKVSIQDNKLLIYTGDEPQKELITPAFAAQLTRTFKSLLYSLKFNSPGNFIEENYSLFEKFPEIDTLKKVNEFSFTDTNKLKSESSNSIKSSRESITNIFDYLYSSGVRNGIEWKEIDTQSFVFTVQDNKHIELKYRIKDEEFVIEIRYEYNKNLNKNRIWVSGPSEPLTVFNYEKKIDLNRVEWFDEKIDYAEYMNNEIIILNTEYPKLSKSDLKYIENSCYTESCIYNGFGNTLLVNKEYKEALGYFNTAIKLSLNKDYNFYHSLYGIGCCKVYLQDYRGAISTLNEIDIKYRDYLTFYYLGEAQYNLGNYKEAVIDYSMSIKKDSTFCWSYLKKGDVEFLYLKSKKMACEDWSRAGELGCENAYDTIKEYCN